MDKYGVGQQERGLMGKARRDRGMYIQKNFLAEDFCSLPCFCSLLIPESFVSVRLPLLLSDRD